MTDSTFNRIKELIHTYHTWIDCDDEELSKDIMVYNGEGLQKIHSRILRVHSVSRMPNYPTGRTWDIPESDIDTAIQRISLGDPHFHKRMKSLTFDYRDVDRLILEASFGIVRLELEA